MARNLSIIIAGGGIAGLTAALTLAARGNRVSVYERAERVQPIGAGIQLSPNAMRVLDGLGVVEALRYTATAPQGIHILSAGSGKTIATVPLGSEAIARYGFPYLTIHRPDLHAALLSACEDHPDIEIHTSIQIVDAVQHRNGVSVMYLEGNRPQTASCDVLVGADGIWSTIRREIFAYKPAGYSGKDAWRALIPVEKVPPSIDMDNTRLVLSKRGHGVFYPVSAGRYLNLVIVTAGKEPEKTGGQMNANVEDLLRKLSGWNSSLKDLMRLGTSWSIWPMFTITETKEALEKTWHSGSVALVGDAAHGMLPFAAQGAAMAIEDAAVLAQCIDGMDDPKQALARYTELRVPRVLKVAKLARENGDLYHMSWPFSSARDISMHHLPPRVLLKRQDWIYNWRADQEAA